MKDTGIFLLYFKHMQSMGIFRDEPTCGMSGEHEEMAEHLMFCLMSKKISGILQENLAGCIVGFGSSGSDYPME